MSEHAQAYPLQWPTGWSRTILPERTNRYSVTMARARDELVRSLNLLGATNITVSTNIELRRDGLPYANRTPPKDPGVAVYWSVSSPGPGGGKRQLPQVMACDRWSTVRDNMRAVGLAIDGLRAIERSGASNILERAYQGFSALPASTVTPPPRNWWDVLEVNQGCSLEVAEHNYRRLVHDHHPDRGGSHARMVELNAAIRRAREVLRA